MSLFYSKNLEIKVLSYNIVSLKAILNKKNESGKSPLIDIIDKENPDIFFLQEIKNIKVYPSFREKMRERGYLYDEKNEGIFGTCFFSKIRPLTWYKFCPFNEGRGLVVKFYDINIVAVYAQNAGEKLKFMYKKDQWFALMNGFLTELYDKDVLLLGDMNVALEQKDVHFPKEKNSSYENLPGFTTQERMQFKELIDKHNLIDLFRYKSDKKEFTYYSYRSGANKNLFENNVDKGWRLDYYLLKPKKFKPSDFKVNHIKFKGSDHIPLTLSFKTTFDYMNTFYRNLNTVAIIEHLYEHSNKTYKLLKFRQTKKSEHKPLYKALEYGMYQNHKLFIAQQISMHSYVFMSFIDKEHFESYYKTLTEKHMYEVIPTDTRSKLYFDIDNPSYGNLKNVHSKIMEKFNLKVDQIKIKKSKNGFHLICDKYFTKNEDIKNIVKEHFPTVDYKVYTKNRLIRLMESSKIDGEPFRAVNIKNENIDYDIKDYFITV